MYDFIILKTVNFGTKMSHLKGGGQKTANKVTRII